MEPTTSPIVAIDGATIKRIREAKKLTQLYVASVVGVTTDTISRWENNRYPTIKRENAEKLATALEVAVEEILRREPPPEELPAEPPPPASMRKRRWWGAMILLLGAAVAVAAILLSRRSAPHPTARRLLTPFGAPAQVVPVQIKIAREEGDASGFIVKERFPVGWRFVGAKPPITGDVGGNGVKWLIPGGAGPVTISYALQVPRDTPLGRHVSFAGELVLRDDGATRRETIGGGTVLTVAGIHWADTNGDLRIDDNEIMPAYYLTEEMKGLGLDWKSIETIWSARGYTWNDRQKSFEVVR
ncbi:helix-turn-helix transcriptional regulator [Geobacter sp.]|uniref:helix-turn-helix transcriptional regulator n=1 Tax=Geobacter sp. TaxID=46610 RepID=UPI002627609A|nr:helix-turn-helix transcriptional regulator [Geobacter sp.]